MEIVADIVPASGKQGRQALGGLLFIFVALAGISQLAGWLGWPDAVYCPAMNILAWATPVLSFLTLACALIGAGSVATRKFDAAASAGFGMFLFGSLPYITHYVFYAGGTNCLVSP